MTGDQTGGHTHMRRASDHEEGSIKVEIRHMAENINHMREAVDNMSTQLNKIAVHEEKLVTMGQAQERAFSTIAKWETELDAHKQDDTRKHAVIDRFIWMATGIGGTLVVIWALGGWYVVESFKDQANINTEVRMHLHDSKQQEVK